MNVFNLKFLRLLLTGIFSDQAGITWSHEQVLVVECTNLEENSYSGDVVGLPLFNY